MFSSKKFWAMVAGVVITTVGSALHVSGSTIAELITVITGYIIGQGIADAGKEASIINQLGTQSADVAKAAKVSKK